MLKETGPLTCIIKDPISAHRELRCHVNQLRKCVVREEFEFIRPPEDDPNDADDLPNDANDPEDPSGNCYLPQMEERNKPEPGDPQPSHRYKLTDSDDSLLGTSMHREVFERGVCMLYKVASTSWFIKSCLYIILDYTYQTINKTFSLVCSLRNPGWCSPKFSKSYSLHSMILHSVSRVPEPLKHQELFCWYGGCCIGSLGHNINIRTLTPVFLRHRCIIWWFPPFHGSCCSLRQGTP